jgi:hypothetical protein
MQAMIAAGLRFALSVGALLSTAAIGQVQAYKNPDLPADQRIANLLSLMTVTEKIAALSTNSGVDRLGVPSFGSSEGIHGVVQRGSEEPRHRDYAIPPAARHGRELESRSRAPSGRRSGAGGPLYLADGELRTP